MSSTIEFKICPFCKEQIPAQKTKCPFCAEMLPESPEASPIKEQNPEQSERPKRKGVGS
jgi:hypothetical protein